MLAVKDQFPPGFMRAVHKGLSHAYEILGRTQEAEAARSRSGRLITNYWVTAGDGFRFVQENITACAAPTGLTQVSATGAMISSYT